MSKTTKINVTANLAIIGTVSPYSYQVKPKTYGATKQVEFDGELRQTRFTKGAGRGEITRYYAYFMDGAVQHWIELTAESYAELTKNPAAVLKLSRVAEPIAPAAEQAEQPAMDPAIEAVVAPKRHKAKREVAEA